MNGGGGAGEGAHVSPTLLKITLFACLSGFLFGYDLGVIGGALLDMRDDLHLGRAGQEFIVGASKVGAVFGTFIGGVLMLTYGRRAAVSIDSVFFMLGPVLMAAAPSAGVVVLGRLVVGLGIGASVVVVPTYLGEMAPAANRGAMVALYELAACLGMLAAALMDYMLSGVMYSWRWMVGLPALPGAVLAGAMVFLPESPRWLATQGRLDEALAVLHKVSTGTEYREGSAQSTAQVEEELLHLWSAVEKDGEARRLRWAGGAPTGEGQAEEAHQQHDGGGAGAGVGQGTSGGRAGGSRGVERQPLVDGASSNAGAAAAGPRQEPPPLSFGRVLVGMLKDVAWVWRGEEGRALRVGLAVALLNQAQASTSIINYAPQVLERVGVEGHSSAIFWGSSLSLTKAAGVATALAMVDHKGGGRRPLLLGGSLGMAVTLCALAAAVAARSPVATILTMCGFILAYSASWAPIFLILMSEMFSMAAKSPAVSAATAATFFAGAMADLLFLSILNALGAFSFLIYAAIAAGGGVFVFSHVPETKGRTLGEVQQLLSTAGGRSERGGGWEGSPLGDGAILHEEGTGREEGVLGGELRAES